MRQAKKQENLIYNQEEKQLVEKNFQMTQIMLLDFKTAIIYMLMVLEEKIVKLSELGNLSEQIKSILKMKWHFLISK